MLPEFQTLFLFPAEREVGASLESSAGSEQRKSRKLRLSDICLMCATGYFWTM